MGRFLDRSEKNCRLHPARRHRRFHVLSLEIEGPGVLEIGENTTGWERVVE